MATVATGGEDRSVSIGRIFSRGFGTLTSNPVATLGIAFVFGAVPSVLLSYGIQNFRAESLSLFGGLAAAAGQYAENWTRSVIDGWFGPGRHFGTDLSEWVDNRLPGLCATLRTTGKPEVAQLLSAGAWRWMGGQLRLWTTTARTEVRQPRLEMLSSPLVRLLEAADHKLRDAIKRGT